MNDNSKKLPLLSIVLFVLIITLINSVSNMISPNLLVISSYFGFGGDTAPIGVLTFSFMIFTGITMLIFGYLADKIIRKWIVFFGSLVFSIFSLLTITVPSGIIGYSVFFFLTILTGIGYGALIPSIFSLMGDMISSEDRSKGFSFFSIASLFGIVFGSALATYAGSDDWRFPFLVIGIVGILASLLFLLFKEPSRLGKDHTFDMDAVDYSYRIKLSDVKIIFKKKANIWLVVNFVDTIPTGIVLTLLYAYMEVSHGITADVTVLIFLIILVSIILGTVVFGYIGDKKFKKGNKKARVLLALFGNIAPIPFLFVALIMPFSAPNLFPGILIWIVLFSIGMFLNGAVNGNWYATVVDLNLPENRGTVLATSNFFDIIGRAIGPLIGTIIADIFGFVIAMMTSIFFWIFIPLFWIPVLKNVVREIEDTEKIFDDRIKSLTKVKAKD